MSTLPRRAHLRKKTTQITTQIRLGTVGFRKNGRLRTTRRTALFCFRSHRGCLVWITGEIYGRNDSVIRHAALVDDGIRTLTMLSSSTCFLDQLSQHLLPTPQCPHPLFVPPSLHTARIYGPHDENPSAYYGLGGMGASVHIFCERCRWREFFH